MNNCVSVILPSIDDEKKIADFCSSLFASEKVCELILCKKISESSMIELSDYADKIKLISDDETTSVLKAISVSIGDYIMFSDVSVAFSSDCIENMIENSAESACVCNVGVIEDGKSTKLFRTNFAFDELADKPVYCNYLLRRSIIINNNIFPVSNSAFSILSFIAEYALVDCFSILHSVMMYVDKEPEISINKDDLYEIDEISAYIAGKCNDISSLHYIRNLFSTLGISDSPEAFAVLKKALFPFSENYCICAFITEKFGIDVECINDCDFSEFSSKVKNVYYKEVQMPLLSDDIIMEFYSGKLGADTLKKCVGAWIYFKLYRGKSGIIKNIGCKICKRLLGGEFNE